MPQVWWVALLFALSSTACADERESSLTEARGRVVGVDPTRVVVGIVWLSWPESGAPRATPGHWTPTRPDGRFALRLGDPPPTAVAGGDLVLGYLAAADPGVFDGADDPDAAIHGAAPDRIVIWTRGAGYSLRSSSDSPDIEVVAGATAPDLWDE